MSDLVDLMKYKARKEIRFLRGIQCMYRERYLAYIADFRVARERGDIERTREIAADLRQYVGEVRYLMGRQQSAYQRLASMADGMGFVATVNTEDGRREHAAPWPIDAYAATGNESV